MALSTPRYIALAIAPIPSSLLSTLSSLTILIMIFRSRTKLTRPYRRIICGMSTYGFIQGVSLLASVFPQPSNGDDDHNNLLGMGNMYTCRVQGFFLQLSSIGIPLYTTSLAVSFLCAVKYKMSNAVFAKKVEPILHGVTNLFAVVAAVVLVATQNINPRDGDLYWARSYPEGCSTNPEVDCIQG